MIYLDSCAVVKLIRVEPETAALRAWLFENSSLLVTSSLTKLEVARALRRVEPAALPLLPMALATMQHKSIDDQVLATAATYKDPHLRSLDAIHLATAEEMRSVIRWFITYDQRLLSAAEHIDLPVIAPR